MNSFINDLTILETTIAIILVILVLAWALLIVIFLINKKAIIQHLEDDDDDDDDKIYHKNKEKQEMIITKEKIDLFPSSIKTNRSDVDLCPRCIKISMCSVPLFMTSPEFVYEPDPHYAWQEVIECKHCGLKYRIRNST
jgi:uncharacterized membrane protein